MSGKKVCSSKVRRSDLCCASGKRKVHVVYKAPPSTVTDQHVLLMLANTRAFVIAKGIRQAGGGATAGLYRANYSSLMASWIYVII